MLSNILEAINNISLAPSISNNLITTYSSGIRINNVGEGLETFIKDAFSNSLLEENYSQKLLNYQEVFSWTGNQNHPPDIMIKNSDAIEVKKTQSANTDLALNSSYPKTTLLSSDPMITQDCKICEEWSEKDIIYTVGHVNGSSLKSLWMVYGSLYAANHLTYKVIKEKISEGIREIPNVELAATKELGRVNRVDPLGITNLRIRGMWQIQNPRKAFNYLYSDSYENFELVSVIPLDKYNSFPNESRLKVENNSLISINDILVKNPNNPVQLIEAKLIVLKN